MYQNFGRRNISFLSRLFSQNKRPRVYLDISIAGQPKGRMVFELFSDKVPKTSENFRKLCVGDGGLARSTRVPLCYKGSPFHRIIPGFMCQGGDFIKLNGTGGESIYGPEFPDENFRISHDKAGILSMASRGENTNSSQFFITFDKCKHLDGAFVAFGHLVDGMEVLKEIEDCGSKTDDGVPKKKVIISDCGEIKIEDQDAKKD